MEKFRIMFLFFHLVAVLRKHGAVIGVIHQLDTSQMMDYTVDRIFFKKNLWHFPNDFLLAIGKKLPSLDFTSNNMIIFPLQLINNNTSRTFNQSHLHVHGECNKKMWSIKEKTEFERFNRQFTLWSSQHQT